MRRLVIFTFLSDSTSAQSKPKFLLFLLTLRIIRNIIQSFGPPRLRPTVLYFFFVIEPQRSHGLGYRLHLELLVSLPNLLNVDRKRRTVAAVRRRVIGRLKHKFMSLKFDRHRVRLLHISALSALNRKVAGRLIGPLAGQGSRHNRGQFGLGRLLGLFIKLGLFCLGLPQLVGQFGAKGHPAILALLRVNQGVPLTAKPRLSVKRRLSKLLTTVKKVELRN